MSMKRMKSHVDLVPTDIIPLVNYAWECSFIKIESNQRAICDCGWYPLNRNLLLVPILRESMTPKDIEDEWVAGLHPGYDNNLQQEQENYNETTSMTISTNSSLPYMRRNNKSFHINNNVTLEGNVNTPDINFGNGLTQHYIKHIIKKQTEKRH
jgi:hypothetical protein